MKVTLRISDFTRLLKAIEMAEPVSSSGTFQNLVNVQAIVIIDELQSTTSQSVLGVRTLPDTTCRTR